MKCSQIRTYLKEYYDGNLTSELTGQIAAHIGTCAECAKELAFLQSYLDCTKEITMRKAPSQLATKVEQKLLEQKLPKHFLLTSPLGSFWKGLRRLPVPVTALASILLIIIFVFAANNSLKFAQNGQDKDLNSGRANRINPVPVLTLIIKTPVSGNKKETVKKEAASMAASESLRQLSKSTVDESISESNGSLKNAGVNQTAITPNLDNLANLEGNLKTIILKWGGKWTVPTVSPGTNPVPELILTLPIHNYKNFLAGIRQYGELKQPYPSIDAKNQETITIKLQMVAE